MKKTILFILFSFFTILIAFSQEEVLKVHKNHGKVKQSFNVVDEENGDYYLILEDSDAVHAYHYEASHRLVGYAKSEDLSSKFKEVIGHQITEDRLNIFMNTENNRSYGVLTFDFKEKLGFSQEIDFKITRENFISALSIKNHLYILTSVPRKSRLNIYKFNPDLSHKKTEIEFPENTFLDRKERAIGFDEFVSYSSSEGIKRETPLVESTIPNSLLTTSTLSKLYVRGNNIILTSDSYREFTQLLALDLTSKSYTVNRIPKPQFEGSSLGIETNSFLDNENIYQLCANREWLSFTIKNIESQEIINSFEITRDDPITFKNTPIIVRGGDFDDYRELEKTTKFLRKITAARVGISVLKNTDGYEITLGSAITTNPNDAVIIGAMLGGIGGAIIVASLNSVSGAYGAYKNAKTVQVTGVFDENFKHLEGDVSPNIFDQIEHFSEENPRIGAETVLKIGGAIHFGYYDKEDEHFHLIKM